MRLARNAFLVAITLLWAGTPLDAQKMEKMERSEALVGLRGLTVPPIERSETTNLIDAGTIDTDGYSYMTLNLVAELKGSASKSGVLGVLLLPDVEPFGRAWRVLGLVPASVDFTVDFFQTLPRPGLSADAHFLRTGRSRVAANGYSEDHQQLWTEDGELLAQCRERIH